MPTDQATKTRGAPARTRGGSGEPTPYQDALRDIEAQLRKARAAAASIDEPVIAYFIDMAIVEVQGTLTEQDQPNPHDDLKFPIRPRLAN